MSEIAKLIPQGENPSARITITNEFTVINGEHYRIVDGYVHKQDSPATVKTKDILNVEKQKIRLKKMLVRSLILFGIIPVLFAVSGWIQTAVKVKNTVNYAHYILYEANPEEVFNEMFGVDWAENLAENVKNAVIAGVADYAARQVVGDDIVDSTKGLYSTYKDIEGLPDRLAEEAVNGVWGSVNEAVGFDVIEAYEKNREKYEKVSGGDFSDYLPGILNGLFIALYIGLFTGSCFFMAQYATKPLHILRVSAMGGDFAVEVKYYDNNAVNKLIKAYYDKE